MATANELLDLLREAIAQLAMFGVDMQDNRLPPAPDATALKALSELVPQEIADELLEIYSCCDGIILPDVKNGLFMHTIGQLSLARQNMMPCNIGGKETESIFVIGSDGGGSLFAVRLDGSREVLHLPTGRIENHVYLGGASPIEMVAVGMHGFLAWLILQTEEFRNGKF